MDGITGDTLPVGSIVPFGSDTVPENWLLCDGSAVSRTEYAELFSVIGGNYGVGDGSTTFNLPDLRGRVAVGKDSTQTEFDVLGETGGEKTHTLTVEEMPSHEHNIIDAGNETVRQLGYGESNQHTGIVRTDANVNWTDHVFKASATGGGQAHNILQPYQVTNYIIKARQSSGLVATVVDNLDSTSTTDALSANQGKALGTYSFDETVIGYGPNGEKMYRKIITSTGISGTEVQVWHGITNLKQVFMKDASATYNGVTYFNNLTFKDIDDRFVKLHISNRDWTVYITLVYTKTVD